MKISVVTAVGRANTLLSAFDNALQNAGVHNYNLIPLSSVIPPGTSVITQRRYKTPPEEFGHRLYCIEAEIRSDETGKFIAAGLGWYQFDDKRGLFVEHWIKGETHVAVKSVIEFRILKSLQDMCRFRRIKFMKKNLHSAVSIAQVKREATSVLAMAVYQSESWK